MKIGLLKKGLILAIILLFVEAGVIPSMGGTVVEKTTIMDSKSGSYIQDLIDNASDGDTINIPSGIYYENIIINKSVSLIGDDRDTTIIDGVGHEPVIKINLTVKVNISGFTIRNGTHGIEIYNRNSSGYNTITGNIISNNSKGIYTDGSSYNTIKGNIISNNVVGIYLSDRPEGGEAYSHSTNNKIIRNIFLDNEGDAYFKYKSAFLNFFFHLNHWRFNYWNRPRILPKLIWGELEIKKPGEWTLSMTWHNFDWRPALLPIKI